MKVHRNLRRVKMIYAFIKAHRKEFSTKGMCRALGVPCSAFYEWLKNPLSNRAIEDERLTRLIRASYKASHGAKSKRRKKVSV